jgi:hypothetical protein
MTAKNTSTDTTTSSVVYKEAARLVEIDGPKWGACRQINQAAIGHEPPDKCTHMNRFKEVFAPEGHGCGTFWWGFNESGVNERIVALCFMAAMVEAGDV